MHCITGLVFTNAECLTSPLFRHGHLLAAEHHTMTDVFSTPGRLTDDCIVIYVQRILDMPHVTLQKTCRGGEMPQLSAIHSWLPRERSLHHYVQMRSEG